MSCIIQTGFEPDVRLVPWLNEHRLAGVDRSVDRCNDLNVFEAESPHGGLTIQTRGGSPEDRKCAILPDPEGAKNSVLVFDIWHPNETCELGDKGRIQCNLYGDTRYTQLTNRVRLRLDESLNVLRDWTAQPTDMMTNWFILQEYWIGPGWLNCEYPFRLSISLYWNPAENNRLYFTAHGQPGNPDPTASGYDVWLDATWHAVQRGFEVPLGEWLDCRTYYRMGNAEDGRFVFEVTTQTGESVRIFDVHDWTYSPLSPEPVPLQHFNPMKMYTSGDVVRFIGKHDGRCRTWWDDLRVDGCMAGISPACRP